MMIQRMIAPRTNDEQADVEEIFDYDGEVDQADVGNVDDGDRTIKCYEVASLHLLAEVGSTITGA